MTTPEFYSATEAWDFIADYILANGRKVESRVGGTVEVSDFSFKLRRDVMTGSTFVMDSRRNASPYYAAGELIWYLAGSNRLDQITSYSKKYPYFSDDGVTAHGAYGTRLTSNHAYATLPGFLNSIVGEMRENPTSRRLFAATWSGAKDYLVRSNDIPCTLGFMFRLRGSFLEMHTIMRSNDIWLGLPYDVWCFSRIHDILANTLGVSTGVYTHTVGSLHVYDRNIPAIEARGGAKQWFEPESECDLTIDGIEKLVEAERRIRVDGADACDFDHDSEFALDMLELCDDWVNGRSSTVLGCSSLQVARREFDKHVRHGT